MASRQTAAAGIRFLKAYRKLPLRKRHFVTNVSRVVRGMRVVARAARASFHKFIHMDIVQVAVAISEVRQRCGRFIAGNGFFVTHKTKFVIFRIIARIEELREKFAQHPEIGRTVGVVTARAISLFNRAVAVGIVVQDRLHVRNRPVLAVIVPVMAA